MSNHLGPVRGWRRLVPVAGAGIMGVLLGMTAFLRYEQDAFGAAGGPQIAD
ncbi:hypothetical protein [Jatrophihabitans fulvus]